MVKAADVVKVIAIFVLMWATGILCYETGVLGSNPPVDTGFVLQVAVIDENGAPVQGQRVFAVSCLQRPAGWRTPSACVEMDRQSGYTDEFGFVDIESINYTVAKNEVVWLGASTNASLLEADFDHQSFGPGLVGAWACFDYRNVSGPEERGWRYARLVVVRASDGKMIDVDRLAQERGVRFPASRPIEYFWYMDNCSWA